MKKAHTLVKIIIILLTALFLILCDSYINGALNTPAVPTGCSWVRFYHTEMGKGFSFTEYKQMQKDSTQIKIYATGKKEVHIQIEKLSLQATADGIFTDMPVLPETGASMIKGVFFKQAVYENGLNGVVISETLAAKLFKSLDIIGSPVSIDGQRYEICGVYRKSDNLLNTISDTSAEKVYLPITSSLGIGLDLQYISVLRTREQTEIPPALKYGQWLESDTAEFKGLLIETTPVIIFAFGLLSIVGLLLFVYHASRHLFEKLRLYLRCNYLLKALGLTLMKNLLLFLSIVSACALIAVIFTGIRFTPYLPVRFKTNENIFNLPFYIKEGLKMLHESNKLMYWDDSRYLLHIALLAKSFVMCALSVVYVGIILLARSLIKKLMMRADLSDNA